LNMVLSTRRPVGATIAKALGLRKVYIADSMSTDTDSLRSTSHPAP
jgi:hypothetical protein